MLDLQSPRARVILFFGVLIAVASATWLATSVWGADDRRLQSLIGLIGIGSGSFLLLAPRRALAPDTPTPATPAVIAMRHAAWKRLRALGVTAILMSASHMVAGDTAKLTLLTCAAAVAVASAFRVPRRFFALPADSG